MTADDRAQRRAERLAAALAEAGGELEPPWAKLPWIIRGSIGWRMGSGESYGMLWGDFVETRLREPGAFVEYLGRHPLAPRSWRDHHVGWLASLDGADPATGDTRKSRSDTRDLEDDSPRLLELRARADELLGDDVAYPVFVRNMLRTGGMTAPWAWRGSDTPATALRYSSRELGWWARWLAEDCGDRSAWFAAQPEPTAEWAAVAASIRAGVAEPAWTSLDGGAERLIPVMVLHGVLPPPWLGGHPPLVEIRWDDATGDDRDRWAWWVHDTYEDPTTWRAYLDRWPPPADWLANEVVTYLLGDPE